MQLSTETTVEMILQCVNSGSAGRLRVPTLTESPDGSAVRVSRLSLPSLDGENVVIRIRAVQQTPVAERRGDSLSEHSLRRMLDAGLADT